MHGLRAPMVWFEGDPFVEGDAALHYESDGIVWMHDGAIVDCGPASEQQRPGLTPERLDGGLLVPGFLDAHLHLPQMRILGAYGKQLLDWLQAYTFPAEQAFSDPAVCDAEARLFVDSCVRAGVTTPAAFCTVHPESAHALFRAAAEVDMRVIGGKVLMDRNAPDGLRDTAQTGFDQTAALIDRWHGQGRAQVAVTPRFAPTSTPAQLDAAGALLQRAPGLYLQSHVSETQAEVAWVGELFPERDGYVDVYAHHGLLTRRALYGHGIHLTDRERARMAEAGAVVVHCPTSNLFLGSGLFDLHQAHAAGVNVALGSDIGAGTHLCPLLTTGAAYQVASLQGHPLTGAQLLYLATAGSARALDLEGVVGNVRPGCEADLVWLHPDATPLAAHRARHARSVSELLFFMATCGDERMIRGTWLAGHRRW